MQREITCTGKLRACTPTRESG